MACYVRASRLVEIPESTPQAPELLSDAPGVTTPCSRSPIVQAQVHISKGIQGVPESHGQIRGVRGLSYPYLSTFSLQMSNDLAGSFVREWFPCLSKGRIETATKVSLQARRELELWPAGDLAVTHVHFHFTPCSTLSKYFVTCSSEKRSVRRAR